MQPLAGIAFALDGILIGAGDTRFLMWSMLFSAVCVYVPIALASLHYGWGIVGVWWGILALVAVRVATTGARFLGRRWAAVGAPAT
jgi:Na+-driven multidrug efflux pump